MKTNLTQKSILYLAITIILATIVHYFLSTDNIGLSTNSFKELKELNKIYKVLNIESITKADHPYASVLFASTLHSNKIEKTEESEKLLFKMKNDSNNIDDIFTIQLPKNTPNLEEIAARYANKIKEFEFVEPDYEINNFEPIEFETLSIGSSPSNKRMRKEILIQENKKWPTVAVIDTGTDVFHEDIRNNRWNNGKEIYRNNRDDDNNSFIDDKFGWDFINENDKSYIDKQGHGTHISGLISLTTESKIMPLKIIENKKGKLSSVIKAIKYAADNNAEIINFSIGTTQKSQSLEKAIKYANSKDIILVAAAGNSGDTTKYYPAAYPEVIAVGATDIDGKILKQSNHGDWVDVYTLGYKVLSTLPGNMYGYKSGTSQAAGIATAKISKFKAENPIYPNRIIKREIKKLL